MITYFETSLIEKHERKIAIWICILNFNFVIEKHERNLLFRFVIILNFEF